MKRCNLSLKARIIAIAFVFTALLPGVAGAAPQDAGADYEAPSWMKARRTEERSQAAWRAQVRAASVQTLSSSKSRKAPATSARSNAVDISSASGVPPSVPDFGQLVIVPQAGDPSVEALRLQAAEDAADRARLRKAAAQRRASGSGKNGRSERQRLDAAQQSRRQDESRLEAAQESRRQDQRRLEAAQQSRRDDERRLEAAQQSRREDQSRLEAAEQSRRADQSRLEASQHQH